jgi:DHA2 family multidrug resistance protein
VHAALAERVAVGDSSAEALNLLNLEVTRQASMIAYVDDFWLMTLMTLAVLPLLLLVRPAKKSAAPAPVDHAAME